MKALEFPWVEPEHAFLALADDPHLVFFDSAATGDQRAAISYLCIDPIAILNLNASLPDPFTSLAGWISEHRPDSHQCPANWPFAFIGGAAGWLGYDLGLAAAGLPSRFIPNLLGGSFGLYDTVLGFDHAAKRAWALAADRPGEDAGTRLALLITRLHQTRSTPSTTPTTPEWRAEMPRAEYNQKLAHLRGYIAAGDVYQANLTMRFIAERPESLHLPALYTALRSTSPAPFAAYLTNPGITLLSASPERFLRVSACGTVETRPIKGTAARYPDPAEDSASAQSLAASPKERAENLMIVDLLRNDLNQVCEVGSVTVPELFTVESFAQAHHLVSCITGRLRAGLGATDLLRTSFPGGSITGAPKRRAMQIIDELELAPRGPYCGATAWIGFDGAMDSAIIIRTLIATPDTLFAQAGGGITWDSNAEAEYDEVMLKIAPLLAVRHD